MSSFNLCNLPILLLEKVMEKVSPRELIHLSSMANYPVIRKVKGFELLIHSNSARIMMDDFYHSWEPTDAVSEVIVKYQKLLKTFKGPLDTLEIEAELVGQLKNSASIPSTCRNVILTCNGGNENQEFVDILFAEMTMESLYFKVKGCEIKQDHIFALDRLHIESAAWMTPNDLLKCNNKFLQIGTHELAEEAVNAFLLKWLNGTESRLEFALFDGADMPKWDLEIVLAGITTCQFDKNIRDSFYIPQGTVPEFINENSNEQMGIDTVFWGLDMRDALDIRRADGTWASVMVEEGSNQLRFVVWKEVWPTRILVVKLEKEIRGLSDSYQRKINYMFEMGVSREEKLTIFKDLEMLNKRISKKADRRIALYNLLKF